jgi:hypothetical protein
MWKPPEHGEPTSATIIWWRNLLLLITALSALLLVVVLITGTAMWVELVIGASVAMGLWQTLGLNRRARKSG